MDKVHHILSFIALALAFLSLVEKTESQQENPQAVPVPASLPQRPLCPQQFALANYACSRLPFSPLPPPEPEPEPEPNTPPSPDGPVAGHRGGSGHHGHGHEHGHGQGHGHRHSRHRRRQTPEEDNCCRWAREVDSPCVCELLVRLPPFLVRPVHQYTLLVGDVCEIIYNCGGPI